jgi:hypothetical protein
MRVISFIVEWPVIRKILDHLGLIAPDPPKPACPEPVEGSPTPLQRMSSYTSPDLHGPMIIHTGCFV